MVKRCAVVKVPVSIENPETPSAAIMTAGSLGWRVYFTTPNLRAGILVLDEFDKFDELMDTLE